VIYMALRGIMRVRGQPEFPVTFLLDELAQLGNMPAIEDAVSLLAGYGAWLWLLVQDLSQLKAVYPKWETFLANTTLQAFGTQDQYTARYLSEALGSETILVETQQESHSRPEDFMRTGSATRGTALAHYGRPLLMPDEIRRMSDNNVIVLQQGEPPYLLERLDYLRDPELVGLGDANPMYARVQTLEVEKRSRPEERVRLDEG